MRIDLISEHASPLAAIGGADSGGQNVHVAELARALGERGHHVTVYTRRDDSELPDRVRAGPGVTVEHVPAGPASSLPKDMLLPYMPEFGDHLAQRWLAEPPDVVHAHFWMSGLAAHRGAHGTGIPVLQTFHALGIVKRRHQGASDSSPPSGLRLEAGLARDAALVVATCSDEVTELAALGVPAHGSSHGDAIWLVCWTVAGGCSPAAMAAAPPRPSTSPANSLAGSCTSGARCRRSPCMPTPPHSPRSATTTAGTSRSLGRSSRTGALVTC